MPPLPHSPAAAAAEHADLIAALDAGDLAGAALDRATALAGACAGCAALVADLAAIRAALPSLPLPPRRRDYRLTEADAARLRPAGWRRILDWLAAPGSSVRPLATGLATLGIVGLLVGAGLPGFGGAASDDAFLSSSGPEIRNAAPGAGGGAGTEPAPTAAPAPAGLGAPGASAAPAATAAPSPELPVADAPSAAPTSDGAAIAGEPSPSPAEERSSATGPSDLTTQEYASKSADAAAGGSPLVAVSAGLLAAGLLLLLARALAVRRAA